MRQDFKDLRILEAVITIPADTGQALTFGDSDDRGFAFRLNEACNFSEA
jgi:hypothetical protein